MRGTVGAPPFREALRRYIGHRLAQREAAGRTRIFVDGQEIDPNSWNRDKRRPGGVIDGEFEEVDDSAGEPSGSGRGGGRNDPDPPRRLGH